MADKRIVSGSEEIKKVIAQLPETSAKHLQFVVRKNVIDHGDEIARSSRFKAFRPNQVFTRSNRGLVRFWPKQVKERKSLSQVRAGTESYWTGFGARSPAEGTAARIEKSIGSPTNRPLRRRFLLIPQGDMLTKQGKPRRVAQGGSLTKVAVRALPGAPTSQNRLVGHKTVPLLQSGTLPNTAVVKTKRGLRLIQNLVSRARGKFEQKQYDPDGPLGPREVGRLITQRQLGTRTRVLGVLKPTAKQARPLDFFGAWERLRAARDARYNRMLESIVRGQKPSQSHA